MPCNDYLGRFRSRLYLWWSLLYLVFTRMPGESYLRRLRSSLLYLCYVFRALINSARALWGSFCFRFMSSQVLLYSIQRKTWVSNMNSKQRNKIYTETETYRQTRRETDTERDRNRETEIEADNQNHTRSKTKGQKKHTQRKRG